MKENKSFSKIESNKKVKENKLLESAYNLFIKKGINNTSVQDIVADAGVAKGTFYLYFKDKYDLQQQLVIKKSYDLFHQALDNLKQDNITFFEDEIIFIINYVIDELIKTPVLIKFISKDLSLGLYSEKLGKVIDKELGLYEMFMQGIKENNISLTNPEVTLFMIIELVSSTCYTTITTKEPLSIEKYKPFLYKTIRNMLKSD